MPTLVHITDLHIDHWPQNLPSMRQRVQDVPADLFLIGGDNGDEQGLADTVNALREIHPTAPIAWVMGNHDLWHRPYTHLWSTSPVSSAVYLELDNLETEFCTVVGTYGHYDYSGGAAAFTPEQFETFTDGRNIWNDRFIDRLGRTNPEIAVEIADRFRARYDEAIARGKPIVVLTHTWPFAPTDDRFRNFFSAYGCNQLIGDVLLSHHQRPEVLFCGHTHQPARWDEFGFPMINTGSDYRQVRITRWEIHGG